MNCRIIKDGTGKEFLIPGCFPVANNWSNDEMTDREIIKEYCTCYRSKREKYETKTRDEVFVDISKLKDRIREVESYLEKIKEDLYGMETEVFMLGAEEVK